MKKHQLATFLWLVSSISGQTLVDVRTQTKNVDFSGAASTIPAKSGIALPASCKLGEMFFNTTNSPGQNLYTCAPANTWTMLVGGGGSGSGGSGITVPASTTVGNLPQYANSTGTALSTGLKVVTAVGTPGSDSNLPTEQSVRSAISAATGNFSNLMGGINTSATMLIGSGASLAATDSGVIAATSVPANGVTGLAPSATTDTTNASNITNGTLAAARLPALTGDVTTSAGSVATTASRINGTSVPATIAADTALVTSAANAAQWSSIPLCLDSAGQHLNYNTTTHAFSCGTSGGTAGSAAFNTVSSGTNASAVMVVGTGSSLSATGTGSITATSVPASGVSGLAPSATTDTTNAGNITSGTLSASVLPTTPSLVAGSNVAISGTWPNQTISHTVLQASQHIAEGDSITAGYLATPSTMYPTLLAADENSTLTDRAVSGQQACDLVNTQTIKSDLSTIDKNSAVYTMMIGTNDANVKGTGAYEAIYQGCHKAAIAWNAVGDKIAANSTNCTDTGTWAAFTGYALVGEFSTTNGSTKTCTISTFGGPLYAWYYQQDGNGGAFTYSVDGGGAAQLTTATATPIATQNGGTYGWGLIRVTGLAAGSHTIKFTVTSQTNSSNGVAISAIGTPSQPTYGSPKVFVSGVPRQQGDANSALMAQYNADALADVNLLAGDGLGVYFVNIRNYLCTSVASGLCYNSFGVADMQPLGTTGDGGLHPNTVGHNDLKQAWEDAEQFVPYVSFTSGSTTGTVNSGTTGQFAYYTAAGSAVSGHTLVASDIPSNSFQAPLTFTGTGSRTVSGTAAGVSGNCAKWDANGNVIDAGAPCGSGSGSGSSAWASLTPGTNTAGAFVIGSGASLASSGTGTIAATSVLASGVSGMLAAANLPNPTASALGGVESLVPTSHQWINSISTAGVPALSQPAFSDLSGAATDAQLPSEQCTLAKYTVIYTQLTASASATPTFTVATLGGSSTRICLIEISGSAGFTGTGITAATVRLQSGASSPLLYSPNQDIGTAVNTTPNNDFWSDSGNVADRTNQSIVAAFTFTGGLSSALTAGSVYITVGTRTMP